MRWVFAAAALVGLAACAPQPTVLTQTEVFRDPSAQIASQTNVGADRMVGRWTVRQSVTPSDRLYGFDITMLEGGSLQRRLPIEVSDGTGAKIADHVMVTYAATGPGRWTPLEMPRGVPDDELWVMWMDINSRTAAIGTPSGTFGFIIDKNATGGGDRIAAARDIMDWFGYDVDRLEVVTY